MKSKIILILSVVIVALSFSVSGYAKPKYKRAFTKYYEHTKRTKLDKCATCHRGSPMSAGFRKNAYAEDLVIWLEENNSDDITEAFAGVEADDSDEDGISNIDEINDLTFPGDAGDPGDDSDEEE